MAVQADEGTRVAHLYRMVMEDHVCPFGLKSKWLLKRNGFKVDDHPLTTRAETDAFMNEHGVETTPQTFVEGQRLGGYDALRQRFVSGAKEQDESTYWPVLAVFGLSALMAVAAGWSAFDTVLHLRVLEWFAAFSMTALALQKLRDVESFSTMFLNYDLLARRWVPYAYIYGYAEAAAGILMIAGGVFGVIGAPVALFIGTVGAVSVIKAVYVDKRELKCACVGGNSNVPLGFLSLTENLVMVAMGLWMLVK